MIEVFSHECRCLFLRLKQCLGVILRSTSAVAIIVNLLPGVAAAGDPAPGVAPAYPKSQERVWRYQPSQINHPVPKFDYTDEGRAIMLKRFPYFPEQNLCSFQKYRWIENKRGVENIECGVKLKREPDEVLSEEQKRVLAEWGQPNYLRGPYKSTRGDSVIEWAYHPLNKLFQWVDRRLVYEGPLTDQERTSITYGAPKHVISSQLEPNIRRETWLYYPVFLSNRERLFSFTNGKLTYSQETP